MTQLLGVVIKDFEGAVVDMDARRIGAEEEGMVIRVCLTQIQVCKGGHGDSLAVFFNVKQICWHDVEV